MGIGVYIYGGFIWWFGVVVCMVFGFPRVVWVGRVVPGGGFIDSVVLDSGYDADLNLIELSCSHGGSMLFKLVHDLGHWALCRLPRCDFVYNLNLGYDLLFRRLFQRN